MAQRCQRSALSGVHCNPFRRRSTFIIEAYGGGEYPLRESLDGSKLSASCPPSRPTKEEQGLRGRGRSASTAPSGAVPLPCTTIRRDKHRVRGDRDSSTARRLRIQTSLLHSPNYLPIQRVHSSQCCHTGHGHAAGSVVEGDPIPTLSGGHRRSSSHTRV